MEMPVRTRREQIDLLAMIVKNLNEHDRQQFLECIAPGLREEVEIQVLAPVDEPGGRVFDLLNTDVLNTQAAA